MKINSTILLFFLSAFFLGCENEITYGHVIYQDIPYYENDKSYFPHDKLSSLEIGNIQDEPVNISTVNENIEITNIYSGGFEGHYVKFLISPNHEIINVKYEQSIDAIEGEAKTVYEVESAILTIDKDPFENDILTGKYTLQIKEDFISSDRYRKNGYNDTTIYYGFRGKFKSYSDAKINELDVIK